MLHLNSEIIKEIAKENHDLAEQFMKARWPEFQELIKDNLELWNKCKGV